MPLGIKQRLSLAVAVIHRPRVLILDEPTSGVDPEARDAFWELLVELSRGENVTIFVSTHFMAEAERCDRVSHSCMPAGFWPRGRRRSLIAARGSGQPGSAFIAILQAADPPAPVSAPEVPVDDHALPGPVGGFGRALAYARREAVEVLRDRGAPCLRLPGFGCL